MDYLLVGITLRQLILTIVLAMPTLQYNMLLLAVKRIHPFRSVLLP